MLGKDQSMRGVGSPASSAMSSCGVGNVVFVWDE